MRNMGMNRLSTERCSQVVRALVEGNLDPCYLSHDRRC